ncbi:MAG: hypothetical protein M3305_15405 [Actinomycetota bacterium]|nr:hypothetical protein [Actinomycetota bacterium]
MNLQLPPGYYLELDADILMLRRQCGSVLAVFSAQGATKRAIEEEATVDYRSPTQAQQILRRFSHRG